MFVHPTKSILERHSNGLHCYLNARGNKQRSTSNAGARTQCGNDEIAKSCVPSRNQQHTCPRISESASANPSAKEGSTSFPLLLANISHATWVALAQPANEQHPFCRQQAGRFRVLTCPPTIIEGAASACDGRAGFFNRLYICERLAPLTVHRLVGHSLKPTMLIQRRRRAVLVLEHEKPFTPRLIMYPQLNVFGN